MKPARVKPQQYGRQCLDDPDAAQQLQLDGIGLRQEDNEEQRPQLHHQGCDFRHLAFAFRGTIGRNIFAVDIAGEKIGGGDRHDRGRHQCADCDRGEGDADEPARKHFEEQRRHRVIVAVGCKAVGISRVAFHAGGNRHEAQKRDQPQRQRIGGQDRGVAPDHVAAGRAEHTGQRVGIKEKRECRAQRQRDIGALAAEIAHAVFCQQKFVRLYTGEDRTIAAEFCRDDDHRRQHGDIDQQVFHHRDHRGRAQAAGIGVGGEDRKGDEKRRFAANAKAGDHHFHADKLQRDVGHGGKNAGCRHRQRQCAVAETAAHEIGRGDVAPGARHRPQPGIDREQNRIDQNGVGHGEEAHRARAEHQCRHRNEGVGGIEIAAQQEPGDDGAETPPAKAPLMQLGKIALPPARGDEAQHGHGHEQDQKNNQRRGHHQGCLSWSSARPWDSLAHTGNSSSAPSGTHSN